MPEWQALPGAAGRCVCRHILYMCPCVYSSVCGFFAKKPYISGKFKPERHEKFIYTDIYDCYRCCTDFVLRGIEERSPVDRRPFRRHQGHPLRSPRFRAASACGEGTGLLPGRGCQVRPGHPFRPEFQIQPRRAPYARNGLRELPGRPLGGRMEGLGEIPEKGVVRQRHSSPLFERQVRPRVHRRLPARRDRDDPRGEVRRPEPAARRGLQGYLRSGAL